MKTCIHCGRQIPDDASFCLYCETVQGDVTPQKPHRPWKRKALIACAVCAAASLLLVLCRVTGPKTIDAKGAELTYEGYHLILTFDDPREEGMAPEPEDSYEDWLTAEDNAAILSLLYAFSENDTKNARHLFEDLIESAAVETVPRDNAVQMECRQPHYDTLSPDAMMVSDLFYSPQNGTNDIFWTILLKNGDILKLQHSFTCHEIPTAVFTPQDTPLETIEDLQALLTSIDAEQDPETIVYIELPAVTYDGGLVFETRSYNLVGSEEDGHQTTFTGAIEVYTRDPEKAQIHDICFEGENAGITAYAATAAFDCTFTGAKIGLAVYNDYADPHNCLFENCDTGMLYDCPESTRHGNLDLDGCQFRGNGIGMHLKAVANNITMLYNGCVFSGNDIDIRNDASTPIDTSEATFE